jgi:cyclase
MRKRALGSIAVLAGLCALAPVLQAETAEPFTLTEIKPGVFAAIARPGDDDAIGNAGFVVGSDGVLVVDGFATPKAAERLLAGIREKTPLPVRWLVVTHHHLDHWGGGSVFAKAGAAVVAQENARGRMLGLGQQASPDVAERLRLALPLLTYREALTLWLGDRRVDVFTIPGHTDGDSLVSVPDANVPLRGDLLQNKAVPSLSDANTEAWIRTLDELGPAVSVAAIVPGHGGVARPLDIRALRLSTLRLSVAGSSRRASPAPRSRGPLCPGSLSSFGRGPGASTSDVAWSKWSENSRAGRRLRRRPLRSDDRLPELREKDQVDSAAARSGQERNLLTRRILRTRGDHGAALPE